ncbi:MAG: hypothetical protein NT031_19280 [Planctomycetota bacterium]|nr:hypothetical protein [Planctomycetota bacterium]
MDNIIWFRPKRLAAILLVATVGWFLCGCDPQDGIRPRGSDRGEQVQFKATVAYINRNAAGELCARVVFYNMSECPVLLAIQPNVGVPGKPQEEGVAYDAVLDILPPGTTNPTRVETNVWQLAHSPGVCGEPEKFVLLRGMPDDEDMCSPVARYTYETDVVLAPKETLDKIAERAGRSGERVQILLTAYLRYVEHCGAIVKGDASPIAKYPYGLAMVGTHIRMDFTKAGDIVPVAESDPDTRPASQPGR